MYLNILDGRIRLEDIPYLDMLIKNPNDFDINKYKKLLDDADVVTVEFSTLKTRELNGFHYSEKIINDPPKKYHNIIKYYILPDNECINDLIEIQNRINKPIIFISHINFNFYVVRQADDVFNWSRRRDSNPEPAVYKTAALPIELRRQGAGEYRSRLRGAAAIIGGGRDRGQARPGEALSPTFRRRRGETPRCARPVHSRSRPRRPSPASPRVARLRASHAAWPPRRRGSSPPPRR